jgi:hypothetical protein
MLIPHSQKPTISSSLNLAACLFFGLNLFRPTNHNRGMLKKLPKGPLLEFQRMFHDEKTCRGYLWHWRTTGPAWPPSPLNESEREAE